MKSSRWYVLWFLQSEKDISNTTLDEEVKKWTEEWNEEVAQKMKEVVESFMEDYEL